MQMRRDAAQSAEEEVVLLLKSSVKILMVRGANLEPFALV